MTTRGLLITFSGYPLTPTNFVPDNGLASLAACLERAGHSALILDLNTPQVMARLFPPAWRRQLRPLAERLLAADGKHRAGLREFLTLAWMERRMNAHHRAQYRDLAIEISEMVRRESIDWVGLKLWNGDGFTFSLRVAHELRRRHPRLKIFGGGPHVDIFRETIFTATRDFDALLYGEGEETIVGLADYAGGKGELSSLANLLLPGAGATELQRVPDLDALPTPTYDPACYPAMEGDQKIRLVVLDESRGCPNSCHFCIHAIKSGRWRTKSAARVVRDMETLGKQVGTRAFRFAGSNTPPRLLREVAQALVDRGADFEYCGFAEPRGFSAEDFALLRRSGCYSLFFGIESGSPEILERSLNKRAAVDDVRRSLIACREAGIFTVGSVIVPAPGETAETKAQTMRLLTEARPDSVPVQFAGLYPQTPWGEDPERFGFGVNRDTYTESVMRYKIRLLFPPRFWKPLPYTIDGKPFREWAGETEAFARELEAQGLLTNVSDDIALLAKYADLPPAEFKRRNMIHFLSGDAEAVQTQIAAINHRIRPLPLREEVALAGE